MLFFVCFIVSAEKQTDSQEESDEPPKVEVKVIEEKDSLFSTR